MLAASVKGYPELGAFSGEIQCFGTKSESVGRDIVQAHGHVNHWLPRILMLAAGRVLGHTLPVEERERRLRGRYVGADR
jgi:hypothetical protein